MRDKDPEEIRELRQKLTRHGFEELRTREDVQDFLSRSGTAMIVVNSVCSCAGKAVREGVAEAVTSSVDPDHLGTVFAGVDEEATEEVRDRAPDTEPSSPAIYIYRNGDKQTYIPREFTMKHQYESEKVTEKLEKSLDSIEEQTAAV